jgi:putative membrane protein
MTCKHGLLAAAIVAGMTCGATVCAAGKAAPAAASKATPVAAPAGPVVLMPSDHNWILVALAANQKEVDLSNFAMKKSTNEKVRQFAQSMVKDHTQLGADLQRIGGNTMLAPAANPDPMPSLSDLNGPAFDKSYLDMISADHIVMIGNFEVAAGGAYHSAAVRDLARKTAPTLHKHEQMANALEHSFPKS